MELLPVKFTFNSLIPILHDLVVQKIIREIDNRDLAKALKNCDVSVKEKIFKNITKRHRQNIEEDRAYYGFVNIADIKESQEKIMKTIHQLEMIGEIVIEKKERNILNRNEYIQKTAQFIIRAYTASEKARMEGLLALEDDIDNTLVLERDIFEYGMRLVIDGTDEEIVEKILNNIIAHYSEPLEIILKNIQKETVIYIQKGFGAGMMLAYIASFINNADLLEIEKLLPSNIKLLPYDGE